MKSLKLYFMFSLVFITIYLGTLQYTLINWLLTAADDMLVGLGILLIPMYILYIPIFKLIMHQIYKLKNK